MTRKSSAFAQLLGSSGTYFGTAGAFSLAINLLYLAGPLYMLQVYDRVVSSSSDEFHVLPDCCSIQIRPEQ